MIKRLIKRTVLRIIPARWQHLRWQLVSGEPHEADIHLFGHLNDLHGLVLDLGANYGQFALSVFCVNRSLNVQSWEPNPQLRWPLRFVRCLHPWRFRYWLQGAGSEPGQSTLHVPTTPDKDLSTNASLDTGEFGKDYVRERLDQYSGDAGYGLQELPVKITTVDAEALTPVVIKIDVEGWELQALEGMRGTLERHHPMLMIEMNNHERWFDWLRARDYELFSYQHQPPALLPVGDYTPALNVFALHRQSPAELLQQLRPLLPADW